MKHLIVTSLLVFGCTSRTVVEDAPVSELELLCDDWCDVQGACEVGEDYGDGCADHCMNYNSFGVAWGMGCEGESREVLSCLGTSTCTELSGMYDMADETPGPCRTERLAILTCLSL